MSLSPAYHAAIEDFHRMRRRAGLQKIFNVFRRRSSLLSYEDVRRQLHAIERSGVERKSIPISAIQGSVGRYTDFTRDFLPTEKVDRQRWARVKAQFFSLEGVPPIEVYQIGEVYFVADGNHRISVAREMGVADIDAYVRKVATKVPLTLNEDLDQLLIKAELADFLERTQFDLLYPEVDLTVTAPGRYTLILQQIEAIHFSRELEGGQPLAPSEGVKNWYNSVYSPIVEAIQKQGILLNYPERTETDLFLWLFKHRASLVNALGWDITATDAVKNLTRQPPSKLERYYHQTKQIFRKLIRQNTIESGPPPGTWRQEKMSAPEGRLFANIIIVIDGSEEGWDAYSQGTMIAGLEGSQLFGLHISKPGKTLSKEKVEAIQTEFGQRCEACDTRGQLAFDAGSAEKIIRERACWADLVITSADSKFKSSVSAFAQYCPAPLLVTKGGISEFETILLAYDGSPKSEEALFLAAYLSTFWELSLIVITILEENHPHVTPETMVHAKEFLDYYGVSAQFLEIKDKFVSNIILKTANDFSADLIVLGSYSDRTNHLSQKRVLDEIIKKSQQAILICR